MASFTRIDSRKKLFIFIGITILIAILAFVIGFVSNSTSCEKVNEKASTSKSKAERQKIYDEIVNSMSTKNLRDNLRYFAKKPHVASSSRTNGISQEIYNRFKSYGLEANFHSYNTLLSFPPKDKSNFVYVLDATDQELFKSRKSEVILEPNEKDLNSLPPYLAYGKGGTVEGDILFANYGQEKDFKDLLEKYNKNVTGKIVLVKYGKVGRGSKVYMAAKYGAVGVLIYGDPKNYAPVANHKFPNGRWLSDDGVQRGSIMGSGKGVTSGDPLTNGYPAKEWLYHENINEVKGLPPLPAQPIAAVDAKYLLSLMGGSNVGDDWSGDLNVTYRTGPLKNNTLKIRLEVNNKLEMKTIRNVCGTICGEVEPDRYVLLGNHIDAWVFGAVDASSGTTVMMEIARVLGEKVKTGWKPRRTIKLCGWDGEEFNLIGSSEYVEEFYHKLQNRAVAYINIDSAVAGNYSLKSAGSPLLHEMMFGVHEQVKDPYEDNMSVFDKCKEVYKDTNYPNQHKIGGLGAGSDYYAFYQFLGIPSIDISYRQTDLDNIYNTSYYPMYHTLHDTIYWMENFVDREYKIHLTVAKVGLRYLLQLSDTPLLPFSGTRYVTGMKNGIDSLVKVLKKYENNINTFHTELLVEAANNLTSAVKQLSSQVKSVDTTNQLKLRQMNDKLNQFEKGFIYPTGLPGRPQEKHYIMGTSSGSVDYSFPFPAIADLLLDLNTTKAYDDVNKQISITSYVIQSVADSLT